MASGSKCSQCQRDVCHTFCVNCTGTVSCPLCPNVAAGDVEQLTATVGNLNMNTNTPGDGLQTVVSGEDSSRKTIYLKYLKDEVSEEFDGVKFDFQTFYTNVKGDGKPTLCLSIRTSDPHIPSIESYNITYDVVLVNYNYPEKSVKKFGSYRLVQKRNYDMHMIPLIGQIEALDETKGYYVNSKFQFDVKIEVQNRNEKSN